MNKRLLALVILTASVVSFAAADTSASPPSPATPVVGNSYVQIPRESRVTSVTVDQTFQVQYVLKSYGYTIAVDGIYGPQTTDRVRRWQRSNGLVIDGIAGPVTRRSLGLEPGAPQSDSPGTATEPPSASRGTPIQVTDTVPPPTPEHYDEWVRLAVCESGSRWDYNGSSGYDGGLQFSPRTWTAMGGGEFAQYAWQASMIEQMVVAERTLDAQGWGAWPTCSRKLGLR
jgi:hypothetical protein